MVVNNSKNIHFALCVNYNVSDRSCGAMVLCDLGFLYTEMVKCSYAAVINLCP